MEIESKNPDEIILTTKQAKIRFDIATQTIDADLEVGPIVGPGEFEIGDAAIRGIATESGQTVYDVNVGGTHIGIIGGASEASKIDEFGITDILCTSSTVAIREIEPKVVIATGNIDGMVTELKLTPRAEKKYKLKNRDALPVALEVIALS